MKKNSRAFANQVMLCVLVTFCGGGTVGLGTVWMRHQNSRLAEHNSALEAGIKRVKRQLAETSAMIASAQNPAELRLRNMEFKLGLDRMVEAQVIDDLREPDARLQRMRMKSNQELLQDGLLRDVAERPLIVGFKLAQHP